jgi:hypothetical protein
VYGILSVVPGSVKAQTPDTLHTEDSAPQRAWVLPSSKVLEPPRLLSPYLLLEGDRPPAIWRPALGFRSYQEEEPLPIFDDFGDPIYRAEVWNLADPGLGGALVGGGIGAAAGGLLSAVLFWKWMECGSDPRGSRCSPQEEALRDRVPLAGLAVGGVLGGYIGWRIDRTTWDRALERIRERRREARLRGGGGS